tara:strand:+ start:3569 stop:4795 length:1227 start_codon:yes stop_codon:yes gene_type:complete
MDANEIYLDLQLRYQHRLRRLASRILGRSIELVSLSDRELLQRLRRKLPVLRRGKFDFAARRYLELMEELRVLREQAIEEAWKESRKELKELSYATQEKEEERTLFALPVKFELTRLPPTEIISVLDLPFAGGETDARTLMQWKASIVQADFSRIQGAVQSGLLQGLTTAAIIQTLAGTRRQKFADGVLAGTRRNVQAVLSAGVTHVHNAVSGRLFEKNPDVYRFLQWVSVLDGRTSVICRARDGKFAPIGDNKLPQGLPRLEPPTARPPAHPNCRSAVVPVFDSRGLAGIIGERPFVRETAKDQYRKINFRQQARDGVGSAAWRRMSAEQRQRAVDTVRDQWLQDRIGSVPADLTYDDWLRGQPVEFQNEVLGRRKAVLFRKGLKLDRFVDSTGRQLTIEQLRELLE